MTSLFLSHSSEDRDLADQVSDRLTAAGYGSVFLDFDPNQGIPAGGRWERELYAALRRSDGVVFVGTDRAAASRWCFAELAIARSLGTPIFALAVGGRQQLGLLDDVQWVDFSVGEPAYERLLDGLVRAGLDPSRSFTWDQTRPPYPGLKAFSSEDAAVFFGRSREIDRLTELLHPTLARGAGRWVSIIGPSGSGKSSLLFAGLLPGMARMDESWVVVPPFVPGVQPTRHLAESLTRALAAEGRPRSPSLLQEQLTADDRGSESLIAVVRELSESGGSRGRNVLVSIDQAEELITRTGRVEQQTFLRLLAGALHEQSPLWVVSTVRSEFLSTDPDRAGLTEVTDDALVVEPLSKSRLPEVIAEPAHRAGLDFAPGLVERMVEETSGGDALPLLAYTLSELTKSTDDSAVIRHEDYDAIGGVVGALQRRADQLRAELTARGHGDAILPTLLKLVSVDQDGEPIRRRLPRRALTGTEQQVVDAFVEARLLVTGREDDAGGGLVEVAHEALLRQWLPLREAIEQSRTSIQTRAELEREAADWDRQGREESYLLRGGRLVAIQEWVIRTKPDLTELERSLLHASRDLAAREIERVRRSNRRLRQLLVGALAMFLVAAASGLVAVGKAQEAERQEDSARVQSDTALTRQLLTEAGGLRSSQPDLALLLTVEAAHAAPEALRKDAVIHLRQSLNRSFHIARQLVQGDAVNAVAFSQNGLLVASASNDRTVQLWDAATGERRGTLTGHGDSVHGVAISPQDDEGTRLASASNDGTVRLWDTTTGEALGGPLLQIGTTVGDVAYNRDGSLLAATTEDGSLRLWDLTTGKQRPRPLLQDKGALWRVAFSPDGSRLATAGQDGSVRLVDVASGRPEPRALRGHTDWVNGLSFSPDGTMLASAGKDGQLLLWDVASRHVLGGPLAEGGGELNDVAFSPDGTLLAWGGRDSKISLWDVRGKRLVGAALSGHGNAVRDLAFNPRGDRLASASYDGTIRVWDVAETWGGGTRFDGRGGRVNDVAFSPSEPLLASAAQDGKVRLFDLASRQQRREIDVGRWVGGLAFSPDGGLLATASADSLVRLWEVGTGAPRGQPLVGHTDEVSSVAFSPDGATLASAGKDGAIRLWDVADGVPLHVLPGDGKPVPDVAFTSDSATIVSGSADGLVQAWDVGTGRPRGEPGQGHAGWVLSVAVTRSDQVVSAGGDGTVRLWPRPGEARARSLAGHADEVFAVATGPDGDVVASVGKDGTARVWSLQAKRLLGEPLTSQSGALTAVAFDTGRLALAVGGSDGTVQIIDLDRDQTVSEACRVANRDLSQAEWDRFIGSVRSYRACRG